MDNQSRIAVVYHSADLDGLCSKQIVEKYYREKKIGIDAIGWDYGHPIPYLDDYKTVYLVDISFKPIDMLSLFRRLGGNFIWIDHHVSAIKESEEHGYNRVNGTRKVGIAACELVWEYVYCNDKLPRAVELLSAYDVWNKGVADWDSIVLPFQYGMRNKSEIPNVLLEAQSPFNYNEQSNLIPDIIKEGKAILEYINQKNKKECTAYSFEASVNGYRAICINSLEQSSNTLKSVYREQSHDLIFIFAVDKNSAKCSLRTTKDHINVGEIAKSFGGGGHKKAAGFEITFDKFYSFLASKVLCSEYLRFEYCMGGVYDLIQTDIKDEDGNKAVLYQNVATKELHTISIDVFFGETEKDGKKYLNFKPLNKIKS